MPTLAEELDIPHIDLMTAQSQTDRAEILSEVREQSWIARTDMGYAILRYEDCVAFLRDRRWHQAAAYLPELLGVDIAELTGRANRRPGILAAEGDEHSRLRRLVAPAFTPKAADRLRPYMREVVNRLIDPVAASGRVRAHRGRLRALPDPDHLQAARRARGGLEAVQPVGHGPPSHLQCELHG